MNKEWEIKKLGEVCDVEYGTRVVQKRDGGSIYPVYGGGGATFFMDTFNRENNLVVARFAMSAQCTRYVKGKFFLNDSGLTIKPKNKEELSHDFLNLQMVFLNDIIYSLGRGTAQKNLDVDAFRNLEVIYPKSLPEQRRIVSILDECFSAIERSRKNAEQNLKNAKKLFESYLQGVFGSTGSPTVETREGWKVKQLKEVAKHSLGKMLDKNKNKGEFKKYLRNQNVRWFEFDLSDLNEMPFLENEHEKYSAFRGDVLICEGGYPGRSAIWDEEYPIFFQKAIHRVRFHKQEYNKWFLYYLFLLDSTGTLKDHFTGTGIQHFTGESLGKLLVPIPPLTMISALVSQLDALRTETQKLEAIYQKKIANLDELKKSILKQAFAGELTENELQYD